MRRFLLLPLLTSLLFVGCDCGGGDDPDGGGMDVSTDGPTGDVSSDVSADAPTGDTSVRPDGAACGATGTSCAMATDCCSNSCVDTGGADCAGGGGCMCAPRGACTPAGMACDRDSDCCNNLCSDGTCAEVGACSTQGEPCSTEGLSGSCCSTVCLDNGDGPRCQFLGGCRVQDDLCTSDAQCCSGACNVDGMTSDGREIRRCANVESCLPAGEVCGEGGASSNCCPNGGGDTGCEPTTTGFRRCLGGDGTCTLPGRPCMDTSECCMDAFPAIMCQPGPSGDNICCLDDGEECALGDVCCSGVCAPDPADGVLRCGAMCIPDGSACTTDADCCGCGCIDDGMGGQVCTSDATLCDPCTGPSLGEFCDPAGEACCNAPAVTCQGIEFTTCQIAP